MVYDKIQKAITVYVPGNLCNLRCRYCYVSECLERQHIEKPFFNYSVEHMIMSFRPERIGGIAYFTVIGGGETLLPDEVIPFVKGLLHYGHVVEVVTNNTLDNKIEELIDIPLKDRKRLIVKCSLHWNELVRLNKVKSFFANIRKVLEAGASSYPFLVICDDYLDKLEEIRDICLEELGELPQCTPCVVSESPDDFLRGGASVTQPACTPEFIQKIDNMFHSRLFTESIRFLNINPQKVFCYAGKWGFGVNMATGTLLKCHNVVTPYNFFEKIEESFELDYVGCECGIASCGLQYPLFGLGMIPEIKNVPTYSEMICNRKNLFSDEVRRLMDTRICDREYVMTKEEEIVYLMDRISEKNKLLNHLMQVVKSNECNEALHSDINQEMVEGILGKIDAGTLSYEDMQNITYEHIYNIYKVCITMEDGMMLLYDILEMIYQQLLETHEYIGVDVIYENSNSIDIRQLFHIPITAIVAEKGYVEVMEDSIRNKDYQSIAQLYCDIWNNCK